MSRGDGDGQMNTAMLPKGFFRDHRERDLPTPTIIRETRAHFEVDCADPAMADLRDDAEFYAAPDGPDQAGGVKLAAIALLRSLNAQCA